MKIAIECNSPLLQKSLEIFLKNYLTLSKKSDIIIRDEVCHKDEKYFCIASSSDADLLKPFSKSQLILALEKKYAQLHSQKEQSFKRLKQEKKVEGMDFSILEKRIETLTKEYQANILQLVKAFYEK